MKHVYIFTKKDLYAGEKTLLEEKVLEDKYGNREFLVFEGHNEVVNPHDSSVHQYIGDEEETSIMVAEF